MIQVISYFATVFVLLGVYFISKPALKGQYLIVTADILWLLYSLLTAQHALSLQSVILLVIGLTAIRNWKRQGIKF